MINIIFGVISGIISSLGIGGGTILIFLLISFSEIEQHIAQGVNLIFFIPTSIVSIFINLKNNNIEKRTALIVSIFGIIGAILGARIAVSIDVKNFKKYFGLFLLIIAFYEIFSLIKFWKKGHNKVK